VAIDTAYDVTSPYVQAFCLVTECEQLASVASWSGTAWNRTRDAVPISKPNIDRDYANPRSSRRAKRSVAGAETERDCERLERDSASNLTQRRRCVGGYFGCFSAAGDTCPRRPRGRRRSLATEKGRGLRRPVTGDCPAHGLASPVTARRRPAHLPADA